jgi:hypothetical protein
MLATAFDAYDTITGRSVYEATPGSWPLRDAGERWDFNDSAELQRRYPRLWACLGYDS